METEPTNTKSEPEQKTTQANEQSTGGEADKTASPPVVQPLNAEGGEPKPAESYGKTDRKQDETLQTIAEQTEWEKKQADALDKQTGLMEKQTTWMRRQAIWTAALTVVTLLVLIYHGYVMREQSRAADDQTAVMKGQSEAMKTQTEIMGRQLKSMESDSAQTQQLIDQNKDLVAHAGEQAEALAAQVGVAKSQADASVAQAEAARQSARATELTAGVTQKTFYIGERPYVWVREMSMSGITAGQQPKIVVTFENAGRTPALNFLQQTQFAPTPQPLNDILGYGPIVTLPSQGFIPAGGTTTKTHTHPEQVSEADIERIKSGKLFLYFWGFATYEDGVGRKHTLKFCGLYAPSRDTFQSCPFYNSTD